jgi:hypothetical protein
MEEKEILIRYILSIQNPNNIELPESIKEVKDLSEEMIKRVNVKLLIKEIEEKRKITLKYLSTEKKIKIIENQKIKIEKENEEDSEEEEEDSEESNEMVKKKNN